MTLKEHFRRNIVLAVPVVVGQLSHIMVSVADTVMVGQVGVVPLAAATFAGTIYHILMVFGLGVSYAITPLVAATDPGDQPGLLRHLQSGWLLNFFLSLFMVLVALVCSFFLGHFGQEPEVAVEARSYLVIMASSLVPLMIFQTYRQFAEGLSDTLTPMLVAIFSNLVNVGFNYVLIYGHFGFPALGLDGAGYATFISRVVMALAIWWLTRARTRGFQFHFELTEVKRMISIGVPSGMQYVFEVGAFAAASIMVGWISAEALAAHQIALNLAAISYMCAVGLGSAAAIRIGNQVGLKDQRNLKIAGYSSFMTVVMFMSITACLFILFRHNLTALYVRDPDVRQVAAGLMIIAAAFQLSDGIQAVGLGVLRGLTDVKVPTMVTFVAYWLLAIPCGYLLGFVMELGISGVWYALSGGLTIAGVSHILRFRRLSNRMRFND